jgi:hypothetical protein
MVKVGFTVCGPESMSEDVFDTKFKQYINVDGKALHNATVSWCQQQQQLQQLVAAE